MADERRHERTVDDVGSLVDRRAALLATGRGGTSIELDRVTAELRSALDGADPAVCAVQDPTRVAGLLRREPVHPVDGDEGSAAFAAALADRTDVDRRVFELAHPALPGRPLNVVWVALCRGIPSTMADLLDDRPATDPATADTAVFWSIWNAEDGLAGLGRGVDLILGAAGLLAAELPALRTFVTLSPVPGLRRWMTARPEHEGGDGDLAAVAAEYLTTLRDDGRPLDPVARFHLRNGARLWRVLPGADPTERGSARSYGLMANYRYEPEDRDANRSQLAMGTVAVGPEVAQLLLR